MDIATIDIKAACLEVDIDEEVYMTLEPALVDIAAVLDPAYNRQRRSDGGVIVNLRRALYGTIQAARLWHQRLSKLLVAKGFEKNPVSLPAPTTMVRLTCASTWTTSSSVHRTSRVSVMLRRCYCRDLRR
jgi:hypothetical protein